MLKLWSLKLFGTWNAGNPEQWDLVQSCAASCLSLAMVILTPRQQALAWPFKILLPSLIVLSIAPASAWAVDRNWFLAHRLAIHAAVRACTLVSHAQRSWYATTFCGFVSAEQSITCRAKRLLLACCTLWLHLCLHMLLGLLPFDMVNFQKQRVVVMVVHLYEVRNAWWKITTMQLRSLCPCIERTGRLDNPNCMLHWSILELDSCLAVYMHSSIRDSRSELHQAQLILHRPTISSHSHVMECTVLMQAVLCVAMTGTAWNLPWLLLTLLHPVEVGLHGS